MINTVSANGTAEISELFKEMTETTPTLPLEINLTMGKTYSYTFETLEELAKFLEGIMFGAILVCIPIRDKETNA